MKSLFNSKAKPGKNAAAHDAVWQQLSAAFALRMDTEAAFRVGALSGGITEAAIAQDREKIAALRQEIAAGGKGNADVYAHYINRHESGLNAAAAALEEIAARKRPMTVRSYKTPLLQRLNFRIRRKAVNHGASAGWLY
jgi:hypothetical protein